MYPGAKCSNEAIPLAEGPAVAAGPFTGVPSMNNSLEVGCCRNCFGGCVGPRIGADDLMASERVARSPATACSGLLRSRHGRAAHAACSLSPKGLRDSDISKSDSTSMGYANAPLGPSSVATIDPSDSDDSRFSFGAQGRANHFPACRSPQGGREPPAALAPPHKQRRARGYPASR